MQEVFIYLKISVKCQLKPSAHNRRNFSRPILVGSHADAISKQFEARITLKLKLDAEVGGQKLDDWY